MKNEDTISSLCNQVAELQEQIKQITARHHEAVRLDEEKRNQIYELRKNNDILCMENRRYREELGKLWEKENPREGV